MLLLTPLVAVQYIFASFLFVCLFCKLVYLQDLQMIWFSGFSDIWIEHEVVLPNKMQKIRRSYQGDRVTRLLLLCSCFHIRDFWRFLGFPFAWMFSWLGWDVWLNWPCRSSNKLHILSFKYLSLHRNLLCVLEYHSMEEEVHKGFNH